MMDDQTIWLDFLFSHVYTYIYTHTLKATPDFAWKPACGLWNLASKPDVCNTQCGFDVSIVASRAAMHFAWQERQRHEVCILYGKQEKGMK